MSYFEKNNLVTQPFKWGNILRIVFPFIEIILPDEQLFLNVLLPYHVTVQNRIKFVVVYLAHLSPA
jgi:hypothetical protein